MAEPSAPLLIGGGGSTVVVGEHLLEALDRIARSARTCETAGERLRPIAAPLPGDPWNGTGAELEQAAARVRAQAESLELLGTSVRLALDAYGEVESRVQSWVQRALEPVASTLAFLGARLGLGLLPTVLPALGVTALAWMLLPKASRESFSRSTEAGLERVAGRLLDDPMTTRALRLLMTATDDAALGALGVPPALLAQYRALGLDSVAATAGTVLAVGAISGDRGRAPVVVAPAARPVAATAPFGVADRVARIPDPAQPVRVERFVDRVGQERFEVYIAGTAGEAADGGPLVEGGEQPFDFSSNIALLAEHDSSSLQAARQALAEAGAGTHSEVVFTGYSQGAAVATLLAESGEFRTAGLVTVGGPTGGMPVTGDYPAVVIAHDDDPVTALGGPQQRTEAIVVTAPRGDGWSDGDPLVAGHALEEYRRTAERVDATAAPLLRGALDALPNGARDVQGEATAYTARRLSPEEVDAASSSEAGVSGCDPRSGAAARR